MKQENSIKRRLFKALVGIVIAVAAIRVGGRLVIEHFPQVMFRNKEYGKNIEAKAYIATPRQVQDVFTGGEIKQSPNRELTDSELFIVIRLKNVGKLIPWGTLQWKVYGRVGGDVDIKSLQSRMDTFTTIVIPVINMVENREYEYPQIEVEWKYLYTE